MRGLVKMKMSDRGFQDDLFLIFLAINATNVSH